MADLTVPSKSTLFKIFSALLLLGVVAAAGTFSYLGFVELQQLNDSITEDRDRLTLLEYAPTPTLSHPDYSAADRHPAAHLHPDNFTPHRHSDKPASFPDACSHVERSVHANQALRSESGNHWGQRDRLGV